MSWIEDPGVSVFGTLNITELNVDEAWLNVSSLYDKPLWLYELSSNCHQCPFERQSPLATPILPGFPQVFKILTQFRSTYRLRTDGASRWASASESETNVFCEVQNSAGEFGVYELSAEEDRKCSFVEKLEPVNIYYPLAVVTLFYICLTVVLFLWRKYGSIVLDFLWNINIRNIGIVPSSEVSSSSIESSSSNSSSDQLPTSSSDSKNIGNPRRRKKRGPKTPSLIPCTSSQQNVSANLINEASNPVLAPRQRFRSIDTFRGICIVIMVFVDDGGGYFPFFEHATWNGLTVADLAFPWFLWIMGVCIPISIRNQKRHAETKMNIFKKIVLRSLNLLFLGLVMNTSSSPKAVSLETIRFPGVLQRFALCYFLASTMFLFLVSDDDQSSGSETRGSTFFRDFRLSFIPWIIIIFVVVAHCLIIFIMPVPGCPTGYLGPAGLHLENKYPANCIGGSAGYIDRVVFSENHIYSRPTAKRVYKSKSFDPEGLLGSLTSLFQVWLGVHTGIILLTFTTPWNRIVRLAFWAGISATLGFALCGGVLNTGWIPLNKNLWSLSYVLVTSSLAWILLSSLYFLIDVKDYLSGSPFYQAGMNSILLYVGHNVARSMIPWNYSLGRMNTHFSHLVESLWGTSLWIVLSIYLFNRKLFWVI